MAEQKEIKKRRIMVVDDEELILQLMGSVLITFGACDEDNLFVCSSAQEAWDKLQELDGEVDLIFSDLNTGPGMDGIDLLIKLKIRLQSSNIKFVLMSGFFPPNKAILARKAGVNGFLQKPFLIEDVLRFL